MAAVLMAAEGVTLCTDSDGNATRMTSATHAAAEHENEGCAKGSSSCDDLASMGAGMCLVELLCDRETDCDVNGVNGFGWSPLMLLASCAAR